jgi:hypothetical protein
MSQIQKANVAVVNASASGDNTIITGVTGQPIFIWQMAFTAAGAVNFIFKNGTAGTAQSGAYILTANGSSITFQYTGMPWSWTSPGSNWVINLSGAVAITGQVFYTIGG